MLSKSFLAMLKAKHTKKNGQLKRLKKAPKWLEPLNAERGYIASLALYTFQIRRAITQILIPKLPVWLKLGTYDYPEPSEIKNDDLIDDILESLEETIDLIEDVLNPSEQIAINSAKQFGLEVAIFNQAQFAKQTNSVLGVDVFLNEPWLEPQLEIFAEQNATLIQNLTETELHRVSGIVQRGLQEGASLETVTDNIQETFGMTRRHAKLIARDQTGKLNASLSRLRSQELGLSKYRWQTSGDERVRKSHKVLDGKICRYDDPTVYLNEKTGEWVKRSTIGGDPQHCGMAIQCRCQSINDFTTILD